MKHTLVKLAAQLIADEVASLAVDAQDIRGPVARVHSAKAPLHVYVNKLLAAVIGLQAFFAYA
jgi:hypothetical protein